MIHTLDVTARRNGRWWDFTIPALRVEGSSGATAPAVGQSRSLKELENDVRDVAALLLDIEEYEGELELSIELPDEVVELWSRANAQDARAREDAKDAARLRREAVRALTASKTYRLSQVDAARALGVSAQRISQLAR